MKNFDQIKKSLIVPVYNEQDCLIKFLQEIENVFPNDTCKELEIIFVDDGSTDQTLPLLLELQAQNNKIKIIEFSRNFGKEAALMAGIKESIGDVVIPLDIDLQDPPKIIPEMLLKWNDGYEVVLGLRSDRKSDRFSKRFFARLFYKLQEKALERPMPSDCGDFRLMDRVVVEAIKQLPENQIFMKGLFSWVGFKTASVNYSRPVRISGKTKLNFFRLLNLGVGGIISFSIMPLRVFIFFGTLAMILSLSYAIFIIVQTLLYGIETPGFATLIIFMSLLGSLQLIGIGVLGEYIGRTYFEAKRRPSYIVKKIYSHN